MESESQAESVNLRRRGRGLAVKFTLALAAGLAVAGLFILWGARRGHAGEGEFILFACLAVTLPAALYVWTLTSVILPLRGAAGHMARLAAGDSGEDVPVRQLERGDEIGRLARAVQSLVNYRRSEVGAANSMAAGDFTPRVRVPEAGDILGQAIQRMAEATYAGLDRIAMHAERLQAGCRNVTEAAGDIAAGEEAAASAMEEIAAVAGELDARAGESAGAVKEIGEIAGSGGKTVERGYDEVGEMGGVMLEMQSCGGKIVGIAKAIGDIAFQTNLLALNASVEAARAGRHGQGFTIVAQEVRRLAERTSKAAGETSSMMSETVRQVELAAAIVGKINATFSDLSEAIEQIEAKLAGITHASGQQALGGSKITRLLRDLEAMVRENRDHAAGLTNSAGGLTEGTEELRRAVGWFRRGNGRRQLAPAQRQAGAALRIERLK